MTATIDTEEAQLLVDRWHYLPPKEFAEVMGNPFEVIERLLASIADYEPDPEACDQIAELEDELGDCQNERDEAREERDHFRESYDRVLKDYVRAVEARDEARAQLTKEHK